MKPAPNKHIRTSGAKCFQLLEDKRNNFVSLPPRTVPRLRQYAGTLGASRKERGEREKDGMKTEKVEKSHELMQRF